MGSVHGQGSAAAGRGAAPAIDFEAVGLTEAVLGRLLPLAGQPTPIGSQPPRQTFMAQLLKLDSDCVVFGPPELSGSGARGGDELVDPNDLELRPCDDWMSPRLFDAWLSGEFQRQLAAGECSSPEVAEAYQAALESNHPCPELEAARCARVLELRQALSPAELAAVLHRRRQEQPGLSEFDCLWLEVPGHETLPVLEGRAAQADKLHKD